MTCIRMSPSAIVCVEPWGRLKVGNRYVWVSFHEYCGPSFYWDSAMNNLYDPVDESDPVWPEFGKWLDKFNAAKERAVTKARRPNHQGAPSR